MSFISQTITIFYDAHQDRLNLLFIDKNKQELLGAMTRRFLKGLLAILPEWIDKNIEQIQNRLNQNKQQQRDINQFHHQAAQQNIQANYDSVKIDKTMMPFMIETINIAKQHVANEEGDIVDQIRLTFVDDAKKYNIILAMTLAQLHKLIGEILTKVEEWDLLNPWEGNSRFLGDNRSVMH